LYRLSNTCQLTIRIEEALGFGVVVAGLQVVIAGFGIIVIAAVADGVDLPNGCGHGPGDTQHLAPGAVGVRHHLGFGAAVNPRIFPISPYHFFKRLSRKRWITLNVLSIFSTIHM
jgi:hypothetical protein